MKKSLKFAANVFFALSISFGAFLSACSPEAPSYDIDEAESPRAIPEDTLYIFDLKSFIEKIQTPRAKYDYLKLATALQGLVNRDAPHIYYKFYNTEVNDKYGVDIDDYWLEKLSSDGKLFDCCKKDYDEYKPTLEGFYKLIGDFSGFWDGFVFWDEAVPATSNVASTAAGVYNLLPVRFGGELYEALFLAGSANFEVYEDSSVKLDLTGKFANGSTGKIWDANIDSTGSAKCDAYLWAKEKFLDAGLTNPLRMTYSTDAWIGGTADAEPIYRMLFETALANADFHIAQKSFFWDLSVDDSIAPIDDRGQKIGEDTRTLRAILLAQAKRSGFNIFSISGFIPWNYKYTTSCDPESKMEPVIAEWTSIAIFSSYGGQSEADANTGIGDVSNLSALSHEKLNAEFKQNNDKGANDKTEYNKKAKYLTIYMGDYDSASWTSSCLPMFWDDPRRGEMPLYWPICGSLSERIPHLFNYLYETATPNDYFVAGNNGTGYLTSTLFEPELRPEGMLDLLDEWEALNIKYNKRFDLDILGFHINLDSRTLSLDNIPKRVMESFTRVWPTGVVASKGLYAIGLINTEYAQNPDTGEITPLVGHWDIYENFRNTPEEFGEKLYEAFQLYLTRKQFCVIRTILVSPGFICDAIDYIRNKYPDFEFEVVDIYTMMRLAKEAK
ncbi:MAG: hypothetical protein FWH48_01115 [Oscillospiraceae bacterium]|nr:hypothetical protein [Oscillospiraceae bacterium]